MAAPTVRIELLGGFRVFAAGRPIPRLPTAKQQQLIAFLILHARAAPLPRRRIAAALWPDSSDAQALTNLRRELHHLRDAWPDLHALIDAGTRTLAWRSTAACAVDLTAFEAAAERGLGGDAARLRDAASLYAGDLLPDADAEWIDGDRDRLRQRAAHVLSRTAAALEQDGNFAGAIEAAQRLLRLDPVDEQAWCALMRCHARRGDRAGALHVYQECAALLKKELGVQPGAATRMTYREVLDLAGEAPAVPAPPRTSVYPLVGRQAEWHALQAAWRQAEQGDPRVVLIRGEAGIGKTRLTEELIDWCGARGIPALAARCYAGEGALAYAPLVAWLKSDRLESALRTLDACWLPDIARLHPQVLAGRADVPAPDGHLESWQRLRFFEALAHAFRAAAPVVLIVDDLHWADADTIEWLQYFVRAAAGIRCLIVATVRAEEEQDNAALVRLARQLGHDDRLLPIALGPLDEASTTLLAGAVAEQPLDGPSAARAFRDTEGHPLFIIERGRMALAETPGAVPRTAPARVQSVVAARLSLLSADARAAAEVAAAVGRDFRFDVLAEAGDLEEDALVRALDELWRRHIVRARAGEGWEFTHDRIREVAYDGIGPARARLIHRRIAQALERLAADRLDEVAAEIAAHLDRGGQAQRALPFLERAAAAASRVWANEEAIRCLTHALAVLERLPAGRERDERELALRTTLSAVLNTARGYAAPEVEQNLGRVFLLSRAHAEDQVPVRWLWVAFTMRFMLGDLRGTREVAEQAVARSLSDPTCRCEAHHAMGAILSSLGELEASRVHFEEALAAYDERHPLRSALGSDLGVFAHAWYSHDLWLLGEERSAVRHSDEAVALARRLGHKYSETLSLAYAALLNQMRGKVAGVQAAAEEVVALCEQYGFAYYGDWARVLLGWAAGQQQPREGIAAIEAALARLDAKRAQARRPYYMSLLAQTCELAGDRERAARILDAAIAMAIDRLDAWWLPALYQQRAALEPPAARDALLRRALQLARAQDSRALEARITGIAAGEPV